MLFWELADRYGKVHPDGIHLELPLTHEVLSHLAGARRPSVSGALTRLAEDGRLHALGPPLGALRRARRRSTRRVSALSSSVIDLASESSRARPSGPGTGCVRSGSASGSLISPPLRFLRTIACSRLRYSSS